METIKDAQVGRAFARLLQVSEKETCDNDNEEDTMKKLVTLNVDAILTNDPALCRRVLDQYDSNFMNMVQRIHSTFSLLN